MKWSEFTTYLAGLGAETQLAKVVAIRAEDDPEILKTFTPAQRRIRSEYRNKQAKQMPPEKVEDALERIKQAFMRLA